MRKFLRNLRHQEPARMLRVSAVMTLMALALMLWSMLDPTPLPVMVAMSVAQAIGTIAFALYGYVILLDIRRQRRERRPSQEIPIIDPREVAPKEPA